VINKVSDNSQVPLATPHPIWSRFLSFEMIITACTKIWEISWKSPMDCDISKIKLSGIVVLFPNFFGKIGPFLPFFLEKNYCFGSLFLLFDGYNYFRRNIPLNLIKTSGADLTCSTLIPMSRQRQMVFFCLCTRWDDHKATKGAITRDDLWKVHLMPQDDYPRMARKAKLLVS
jgi:hypothetical protein